ncbi:MAG: sigma-70 family RNA polymerase sigma factor [Acidobacteria bacterium]|nr:sigma-70 family RNA polymerase sigma factor [Acidobacteriota bacterium]
MSARDMIAIEQTALAEVEADFRPVENLYEVGLLARLQAHDLAAFDELVAHFERPVFSICYRLLNDAEDARDAAQETFLKIYRGLAHFRGESGLKTWIYRIAINQAMNQQRWWKRRRREETLSLDLKRHDSELTLGHTLEGTGASPETLAIDNERERRLLHALAEIKTEYRVALMLREIEELSYDEIAATLEISIGTVKSRIARGREELRRRMKAVL